MDPHEDLDRYLARLREPGPPRLEVTGIGGPDRVGILSGSFDPVTVGHLALARAGLSSGIEVVVFTYAVATLPKDPGTPAALLDETARIEGIRAVCDTEPGLAVGLASHGLLVDQRLAAAARFPAAALTFLMGSDKVLQLLDPAWYGDRDSELDGFFAGAQVRYAVRSGEEDAVASLLERPENGRWASRIARLDADPSATSVSSREVRDRIRRGRDVDRLIPEVVRPIVEDAVRIRGGR